MKSTEMRMNCKVMAALVAVVGLAFSAFAAGYTFPNAGGDLADETAWGGTKPGDSDYAIVDKAGTYTLSSDVTFGGLRVLAGSSTFNFGNHKMTAPAGGIRVSAANAANVFYGGTFNLSGTANCNIAYDANNVNTIFTNGCIVTNVNTFYAARYSVNSKTEIAGGAKVYAKDVNVTYDSGSGNTLDIHDGGQLHLTGNLRSDGNHSSDGAFGGNSLFVRGVGSQLNVGGDYVSKLGFHRHSNVLRVADGATAVLNGGIDMDRPNNRLLIENGASATIKRIRFSSSGNSVLVSNATISCSGEVTGSNSGMSFIYSASASNSTFRALGSGSSLTLWGDFFGKSTNGYNTVSLEGGVVWDGGDRNAMMARTHHSVFRIAGSGTSIGNSSKNFYIGDKDNSATMYSASNRLEVLDGATLNATRVPVMGIANTLCISNATLNIGADSVGLAIGYATSGSFSTNCMLVLQGATPKITIAEPSRSACIFYNSSTLRFEIPKEGYAEGYVPFTMSCQFGFKDRTSRVEIDCEEFVEKTGGKLHLIHAASLGNDAKACLNACASTLPEGCSLIIDGGDVYIKSPRKTGFILMYK